jgi:hypothetical protein
MRVWLAGIFVLIFFGASAQPRSLSFFSIDWQMRNAEATTPDSLARFISFHYITEMEKVRAIYSWMTSHIAYNTGIYKPRKAAIQYMIDPLDTAAVWPSGDEMTARKVMLRKEAVCDGYARLFKVLCQYVGVEAEVVHGYGRTNGTSDRKFRTNHTWNAVRIDSAWHLLDVTWAAGHIDFRDDFVANRNDFYFLTPPSQFIQDHYPEDLRWTLLQQPPTLGEFRKMPFRSKNFIKYDITSFSPSSGVIEARVGDTLTFTLQLKDGAKVKRISPDPFADTAARVQWPFSTFIHPAAEKENVILYTYIAEAGKEWLHLVYNEDVVIRYRMNVVPRHDNAVAGN